VTIWGDETPLNDLVFACDAGQFNACSAWFHQTPARRHLMAALFSTPRRIRRRFGPYSKATSLTAIDGRCRAARQIREFTAELMQHIGPDPTAAERVLVNAAAVKHAKMIMLADKILADSELDLDLATRTFLAWSNSLRRDLEALGLKRPQQMPKKLADVLRVA
jgi:hypothetical protein